MTIDNVCKVVIVDDDRTATDNLYRELAAYPQLEVVGSACNGAKGHKLILEQRPDLVFLDVELPDTFGFKLLGDMRYEVNWNMQVIFYTAYDKYMLQAIRESAFDYLLKPFVSEDLSLIMKRYFQAFFSDRPSPPFSSGSFVKTVNALLPARDTFMINAITGFKLLHLEEIGFFEYIKEKRLWQVTLFNQTMLNLKNNTKAENIIGYSESFVQISQSAIININYLAAINGRQCQLYPPFNRCENLVISRGCFRELQEKLCLI